MPPEDTIEIVEPLIVPEDKAQKIMVQSIEQLATSRRNKRTRMAQINEIEGLYHGITEKSIRNPFNESFPYMPGFIDYHRARIDDDSLLTFTHQAEADLKKSIKIQGLYDRVSTSSAPNDSWSIKHRYAKLNALFSGRGIYKYFAENDPEYKSYLGVVSHYDFHNEPRGGGQLENHLFCGEDNIFKNQEDLKHPQYIKAKVEQLVKSYVDNGWKDNLDYDSQRNNRAHALGQQPETNNYVGQGVIKLVDWCTTFEGERYYILFNESARTYVRCLPLVDMFPDNLWPYVSWATNEDPDVFWSKAPADDALPIAKIINKMVNQELYNREKRNYGQRMYDVEMFPNVAALADWRPDGLIPVSRKPGESLSQGVYEMKVGDLNGTLDLVSWLDNFTGKQIGKTATTEGAAAASKQATVFLGEVEQVDKLINVKNKSFRDALSEIGMRFKTGAEYNLTEPVAVKVMGGKGVEWTHCSKEDLKTEQDLLIIPIGGSSELEVKRAKDQAKVAALETLQAVNPQWKERQVLLLSGFDEDDIKDAFSSDSFAEKELMSEAAQAEKDIVEGKEVTKNRGATAAFIQHIVDFATDTEDLDLDTYTKLMDYGMSHVEIATENMTRNVREMIVQRAKAALSTPPGQPSPTQTPAGPIMTPYAPTTASPAQATAASGGVQIG